MKITECRNRVFSIGFIDPYFFHSVVVKYNAEVIENNLLKCLVRQNTCEEILFPYNFS